MCSDYIYKGAYRLGEDKREEDDLRASVQEVRGGDTQLNPITHHYAA